MSILRPRVRLQGKRRVGWWYQTSEVADKRSFWNEEVKLGVESAHKIKAGPIEWPFEFELSPSMPESVEGLRGTFLAYYLHASVSRPGWSAKDLVAQEHIRIVRTLGQDSMEMTRSRTNSDIWANKISYSISIPTDAIVFGTSITADVELSPIKKGLELGKVELRLVESVVKRIQTSEVPDSRGDRSKTEEIEVAKHDMEFPHNCRVMHEDETVDNPTMEDEMYRFKAKLPLPKSLNQCRQDVDSHQINVSHRFKLMVNLHNPEGHVSQLVCRLPVKIFISPNLPVDEANEVHPIANGATDETLNNREASISAPPQYGEHQLDEIFSDLDTTSFTSRAPSRRESPNGAGSQSTRTSEEDLASLSIQTDGLPNGDALEDHGSATPSILRSRLADLQQSDTGDPTRSTTVSFSNHVSYDNSPAPGILANGHHSPERSSRANRSARSTPSGSAAMSRQGSQQDNATDVQQSDYNMDNLMRVPSYGAALRAPGTVTPFADGPPSYVEATSRPPTPTPPGLQRPSQVHIRSGEDTLISSGSQQTLTTSSSGGNSTAPPSGIALPSRSHRGSEATEEDARLRMLRART